MTARLAAVIHGTLDFSDGGRALLHALSQWMEASNVLVYEFRDGEPAAFHLASGGSKEAYRYARTSMATDPIARFLQTRRFDVLAMDAVVPWASVQQSSAYAELYATLGMERFLVMRLTPHPFKRVYTSHLLITRTRKQPPFGAKDGKKLSALREALEGLALRSERTSTFRTLETLVEGALGGIGDQAALLIDARKRTVWRSSRAQAWVDESAQRLLGEAAAAGTRSVDLGLSFPATPEQILPVRASLRSFTASNDEPFTLVTLEPRERLPGLVDRARDLGLSPSQAQIMAALACGDSPDAIAKMLFVSLHTVRTHIRDAYKQLGLHSRGEAIRLLLET